MQLRQRLSSTDCVRGDVIKVSKKVKPQKLKSEELKVRLRSYILFAYKFSVALAFSCYFSGIDQLV